MIQIKKIIGSGLYTGFFPKVPGTFASLIALFFYLIPGFENPYFLISAIIISTLVGIPIGNHFEKTYGKDPQIFTLDEFIGTWISLLFIPKVYYFIIPTFIIWRILDILKPYPANISENLNGGIGIILDDIISGMYSLIIMHIFITIFF